MKLSLKHAHRINYVALLCGLAASIGVAMLAILNTRDFPDEHLGLYGRLFWFLLFDSAAVHWRSSLLP
jgi:hypothetical protein